MEILIVVALIGILAAAGIPALTGQIAHFRFVRDVRNIAVEMSAARMNAISRNTRYAILVTAGTPDNYRTQICATVVLGACTTWNDDTTPSRGLKTLSANTDIIVPAGNFRVEFLPTGSASAATVTIRNTSTDTEQMTIDVNATTGKVTIS